MSAKQRQWLFGVYLELYNSFEKMTKLLRRVGRVGRVGLVKAKHKPNKPMTKTLAKTKLAKLSKPTKLATLAKRAKRAERAKRATRANTKPAKPAKTVNQAKRAASATRACLRGGNSCKFQSFWDWQALQHRMVYRTEWQPTSVAGLHKQNKTNWKVLTGLSLVQLGLPDAIQLVHPVRHVLVPQQLVVVMSCSLVDHAGKLHNMSFGFNLLNLARQAEQLGQPGRLACLTGLINPVTQLAYSADQLNMFANKLRDVYDVDQQTSLATMSNSVVSMSKRIVGAASAVLTGSCIASRLIAWFGIDETVLPVVMQAAVGALSALAYLASQYGTEISLVKESLALVLRNMNSSASQASLASQASSVKSSPWRASLASSVSLSKSAGPVSQAELDSRVGNLAFGLAVARNVAKQAGHELSILTDAWNTLGAARMARSVKSFVSASFGGADAEKVEKFDVVVAKAMRRVETNM
jgi:hypothetical protein